jgi:hypothetical protein
MSGLLSLLGNWHLLKRKRKSNGGDRLGNRSPSNLRSLSFAKTTTRRFPSSVTVGEEGEEVGGEEGCKVQAKET